MKINHLFKWTTDIWRWLTQGKIVFICILVIIAAIPLNLFVFQSETSIRLSGCLFQIIGVGIAIKGLLNIRTHFHQPPLKQLFSNWLRRFPKWKSSGIVITPEPISCGGAFTGGKVEIWAPDDPEQSIEYRIEMIVKNQKWLRMQQRGHVKSIEKLRNSHEAQKKKMAKEDKKTEEKIRSDLKSLHTKDQLLALTGLVLLIAGIFTSTMAPELSEMIKSLE